MDAMVTKMTPVPLILIYIKIETVEKLHKMQTEAREDNKLELFYWELQECMEEIKEELGYITAIRGLEMI